MPLSARRLGLTALVGATLLGQAIPSQTRAATELQLHTRFFRNDLAPNTVRGTLYRELARQALLVAAREEIGMRTCDATLREKPTAADPLSLLLTIECLPDGRYHVRLFDSGPFRPNDKTPPKERMVWHKAQKLENFKSETFCLKLAEEFERWSRDELVDVLKKLGGSAPEPAPGEPAPGAGFDETERLLQQVDIVSQFIAVRSLHLRLRDDESPEALQALVRGYTNLAMLTETCWGQSSNVYRARALLYAFRLRSQHPKDRTSEAVMAYAESVSGMHSCGLRTLAAIEPFGADQEPPPWLALLEPYCKFELRRLLETSETNHPYSAWSAFLYGWASINTGDDRQAARGVRTASTACPEATGLHDMLAVEVRKNPDRKSAANAGKEALLNRLPARLAAVPGIPAAIREAAAAVDNNDSARQAWPKLLAALDGAPSAGDPAWGNLARLLEDAAVRAAFSDIYVGSRWELVRGQGVRVAYWEPFFRDHPDATVFRIFAAGPDEKKAITAACRELRLYDPNPWAWTVWSQLPRGVRNQWGQVVIRSAVIDADNEFLCQSITQSLKFQDQHFGPFALLALALGKVSPYSPLVVVKQVELTKRRNVVLTDQHFLDWEQRAGESAAAWTAIGGAYKDAGRVADAVLCFERSFDLLPETKTIYKLAAAYEEAGLFENVPPTLLGILELDQDGFNHINAHHSLAMFYLRRGDAEAAKPHAIAAAESHARWALRCAAWTHEVLGELDEADNFYRLMSQGYPSYDSAQWYLFRKRHGMSGVAEPLDFASKHVRPKTTPRLPNVDVAFHWVRGKYKAAYKSLSAFPPRSKNINSYANLLTLAVKSGDKRLVAAVRKQIAQIVAKPPKRRAAGDARIKIGDEQLKPVTPTLEQKNYPGMKVFSQFVNRLTGPGPIGDDLAQEVESFLRDWGADSNGTSSRALALGAMLEERGRPELAALCYRNAAIEYEPQFTEWYIAKVEAQRLPVKNRPADQPAVAKP